MNRSATPPQPEATTLTDAQNPHATLVDPTLGTRQETAFFGEAFGRILVSTHIPRDRPVGCVVICSPIAEEAMRNLRREVLLGRGLAAAGIAVQRIHYRGAGSSDGNAEDLTTDTMLEDASAATTLLVQRFPGTPIGFCGTRLGAVVASAAAAGYPGCPLALWEPVVDGRRYMQEVLRAGMVRDLQDGAGDGRETDDGLGELRTHGVVDVLGYPISASLYDSTAPRRLVDQPGPGSRPALIAQVGPRQRFRDEYTRLAQEWRDLGWDVDTMTFVYPREAWWFAAPDDTMQPGSRMRAQQSLIDATTDWFVRQFGGGQP